MANGVLTQADVEMLEGEVAVSVDAAVAWAEASPEPAAEDALLYTYAEDLP